MCKEDKHTREYLKDRQAYILRSKLYKQTPNGIRADKHWRIRKRYGLSFQALESMFEEQKGQCKICSVVLVGKDCHIDHCHTTKKVRGLLCGSCNRGLGQFKDNKILLKSALDYLETSK